MSDTESPGIKDSIKSFMDKPVYGNKIKRWHVAVLIAIVIIFIIFYDPKESMKVSYKSPGIKKIKTWVPWSSPDYKLRNKNNSDKTRRSDSKEDNWNKKDLLSSVSKFNNIAATGYSG